MDKESFGSRFARLRKARSLTQEDVASYVNISAQAVSKWENDLSSPDISILGELAKLLGVRTDELLGIEEPSIQMLAPEEKKDIRAMILNVSVDMGNGDRVRVNLPMTLVQFALETGIELSQLSDNEALRNLDFHAIFQLAEQGVLGKLVEVDRADGTHVTVTIEG